MVGKFKVGDKVREAAGSNLGLANHWSTYWAKPGDAKVTEFFVTRVVGNSISYSATKDGNGPLVEATFLELVTPLHIEAGKFYKTRDGRKVGPMEKRNPYGGKYIWQHDNGRRIYKADGTNYEPGSNDLIAEWASSCAAAQVDNLRDEYGPVVKAAAGNDNGKPLTLSDILSAALYKPMFKVGDRVIHKSEVANGIFDPGVVTSIEDGEVKVDWQKYSSGWTISVGSAAAFLDHLEQNTPTIVCLIENGQPKPAGRPHVHPSRGHAGDEAARLARKYPGKEFGVYELVSTIQEAKPTYQHEWQRLAAGGERVPAIKAYREAGGRRQTFVTSSYGSPGYEDRHVIGLKEAKDAVEHWLATAA